MTAPARRARVRARRCARGSGEWSGRRSRGRRRRRRRRRRRVRRARRGRRSSSSTATWRSRARGSCARVGDGRSAEKRVQHLAVRRRLVRARAGRPSSCRRRSGASPPAQGARRRAGVGTPRLIVSPESSRERAEHGAASSTSPALVSRWAKRRSTGPGRDARGRRPAGRGPGARARRRGGRSCSSGGPGSAASSPTPSGRCDSTTRARSSAARSIACVPVSVGTPISWNTRSTFVKFGSEPRVAARRHLEPEAVRVEEERRVVLRVVLRPQPRRVQDLAPGRRRRVRGPRRPPPCSRPRTRGGAVPARRGRTPGRRAPAAARASPSPPAGSADSGSARRARPGTRCGGSRPSGPKTAA